MTPPQVATRRTMFPATVTTPDGQTHHPVYVRANGEGFTVWKWGGSSVGAVVLIDVPGGAMMQTAAESWAVDLGEDGMVRVQEGPGCGCSHPMKRWRPPGANKA